MHCSKMYGLAFNFAQLKASTASLKDLGTVLLYFVQIVFQVQKFMSGFEQFAQEQRDLTPEKVHT